STEVISHDWSIRQYQHQVADWIKSTFPPLTATYLQSWFLGVRDDLSEEVNESYSNLGIIHLFAVSGLHVGLLLGIIGYVLKRLGIIQELADIILIMIIFVFIILSGASPSIVRAGSMAILAKLNTKFKWKLSSLDIFSVVFLVNFIIFPLQVYQSGFIYSYWLTFCLIICQSFIKSLPSNVTFFIIPLLAQLAILPIQLSQSYSINLMAYFSNLLFIPIVTSVLIPLLLVTLLIPSLATINEPLIYLFERLVLLVGEYLNFPWVIGALSVTSVSFIIGLLLLVGWGVERKFRAKGWKVILITIILLLEITQKFQPTSKVTFLDVGQGDSTVIQSPYQQCNIVVDTGGKVSFTGESTSIFNQTLKPYLLGEGIRQIDFLILSHGDYDHIGEANELLKTFNVKHLVIPNDSTSEALSETIQLAKELGIKILSPQTNEVLTCGNQTYTFLQPAAKQESENDQSLVMTLEMDELSVLLTGDISTKVERDILSNYVLSHLDIYKAAHHGSKTSNSKPFLKELKPAISVISSGENNRYAHPSQEFLTTLSELNIPSLNTQVDGSIQFERYKDKTWVNLFY
ncbi:MAG: DNA internalization-related competence protein ComEC/Rec2, partial [Turicibacter sp.]|nr:DNA internalization-related competence protein ComEC/Rec2 [Turicibacter sp.]